MGKSLIGEVHQAVLGVPDSDDKGLVGDVKELVKTVKEQNSRIRKNEVRISRIVGILIGMSVLGGTGIGLGVKTLLGG